MVVEVGTIADDGLPRAALYVAVGVGKLYGVGILSTRYFCHQCDVRSVGAVGLSSEFAAAYETLRLEGVFSGNCGTPNHDFCRSIPIGTPVFSLRPQVQNHLPCSVEVVGFPIEHRISPQGNQFRVLQNTIHSHPSMVGVPPVDRTRTDNTIVDGPFAVRLVV